MSKVCMTKDAFGHKAGSFKELSDDEAKVLVDGGYAVELPEDVQIENDGDEADFEETDAEKAIQAKSRELSNKMAKALKKKADMQARAEIPTPGTANVTLTHEEPVHKSAGHWLYDQYKWQVEHDEAAFE